MNRINQLIIAIVLGIILITSRMASPFANFTAVGAVALFAGFYFGRIRGLGIVFASLLVSDVFFEGVYDVKMMLFVYGSFGFSVWLGSLNINIFPANNTWNKFLTVCCKALMSGFGFFTISNLGVWLFSGLYPLNPAGLFECYAMAIPFFKFTWLGDLAFSLAIFGSFYLANSHSALEVKSEK